jgi:HNH endonuclease
VAKRIFLEKGCYALVDDEDAARIGAVKWNVRLSGTAAYAVTRSKKIEASQRLMHRMVLRASPAQMVVHINGNGLDNRRSNLRVGSHAEKVADMEPMHQASNETGDVTGIVKVPRGATAAAVTLSKTGVVRLIGFTYD